MTLESGSATSNEAKIRFVQDKQVGSQPSDKDRVSLSPLKPEDALRALLRTPPKRD
jgi:hypothetical protein